MSGVSIEEIDELGVVIYNAVMLNPELVDGQIFPGDGKDQYRYRNKSLPLAVSGE